MHKMTRYGLCALISLLAGCSSVTHQGDDIGTGFFGFHHPKPAVKAPVKIPSKPLRPLVPPTSVAANEVLIQAIGLVGVPYVWGGTDENGFDCSGLIQHVFAKAIDFDLPRTSRAMSQMNAPSVKREDLKSGDLIFFATAGGKRVTHVAIYVGNHRFVHAPRKGRPVSVSRLDNTYWKKHFVSAKRVITPKTLELAAKGETVNPS